GGGGTDAMTVIGASAADTISYDAQGLVFDNARIRVDGSVELVQVSAGAGNDSGTIAGATSYLPLFLGGTGVDTLTVQGATTFNIGPSAGGTSSLNLIAKAGAIVTSSAALQLASLSITDNATFRMLPGGGKLLNVASLL